MKKKTVIIVSLVLFLALVAVAVISTFPTYLINDKKESENTSAIQSNSVTETVPQQGDDEFTLAGNGIESVLPDVKEDTDVSDGLKAVADAENVKIEAENGALDSDVKVKVKKLGIFNKKYYLVRHYLKNIAEKFTAYDVSLLKDGKDITPNGIVKITFDIPDNYSGKELAVYYLLENRLQEIDSTVNSADRTVTATVKGSGVYVLVVKSVNDVSDTDSDVSSESGSQTSSNVESGISSSTESGTSSDNASSGNNSVSSEDENKDSMDGWSPWY